MTTIEQVRRQARRWWVGAERARWLYATLGRTNSDGTVTVAAPRQNYVYITMDTGTLTQAYNKGNGAVPLRAGLPVKVRDDAGRLIIDGENTNGYLEDDSNMPGTVYSVNDVDPDSHGNVALDTDDIDEGSTNLYYTSERARDDIGTALVEGAGIDITVNDAGDTITIASTVTAYTDEQAQDAFAAAAIDTATIDFTYTDATPEFKWDVKNSSITYAKIQNVSATDKLLGRATAGAGVVEEITLTAFARSLIDDIDAAAMRTTLGLVIGTNVQAYDATLLSIAALGTAADRMLYTTGVDAWAELTTTSYGRSLLNTANAAAARTLLALVIGTDVQAFDAELAAIAGLTSAADRLPYFTGLGTAALATFTAFGRTLAALADAAAGRTALALGTIATMAESLFVLLAGRSGGQTINGGTATGENLTLVSTAHATKGDVIIDSGSGFSVGADPLKVNTFHIGTTDGTLAIARYNAAVAGPASVFKKSRNASVGSHTAVQADDEIGKFIFQGSDGSAFRSGAQIVAYVDGTPGASDMPGRIELQVSPDGSVTPALAMAIFNTKNVGIGIATIADIYSGFLSTNPRVLQVNEPTSTSGTGRPAALILSATKTTGGDNIGSVYFANLNNAGAEKRIVQFGAFTGTDSDDGIFFVLVAKDGVANEVFRVDEDGQMGIGTQAPQGKHHVHDGTGGSMFVTKTAVAGTKVVIIPNATGDVLSSVTCMYALANSDGTKIGSTFNCPVSGSVPVTVGGTTWTFSVAANGEFSVIRTAGTDTAIIAMQLVWR